MLINRTQLFVQGARDMAYASLPLLLVSALLVGIAFYVIDPMPPSRVVLATGPEGSTYANVCQSYQAFLQQHHTEVVCLRTQGSVENIRLLRQTDSASPTSPLEGRVDAAFIGYLPPEHDAPDSEVDLFSLGLVFRQPLWVFYRKDVAQRLQGTAQLTQINQLLGWHVNIGPPSSGGHALMTELLRLNHMKPAIELRTAELSPREASDALIQGRIDAMAFVAAPDTPILKALLENPRMGLLDMPQAKAYVHKVSNLIAAQLPRATVSMVPEIPDRDVRMIGTAASLIVREDTHPALQNLLLMAAHSIHQELTWTQHEGEFPIGKPSWYPLSHEAERFYRQGPSIKNQGVPFWLVNFFERMWMALISILAIMATLSRVVPSLYTFQIRSGIFRWYADLQQIETALTVGQIPWTVLRQHLDEIESNVSKMTVPLARAHDLYALRSHIALVGQRINAATMRAAFHPSEDVTGVTP
ncbi:MAG: TAXI family TRAP transporter solute-binding subunit [Leptothrix ochracea]|uniref:TAXI family TRAP transporter solute-binding subunit n=1 Tax=Leptothrix ochracea TaxID=735331 RepID=UPI0034E2CBE4